LTPAFYLKRHNVILNNAFSVKMTQKTAWNGY